MAGDNAGAYAALAGSPFYLTAERSFSNTEAPSIRLDYTVTDQPMLIRVLKADNLENFLDGQFNVSRSYEQPVSELNPGHYFAKGLNHAQSPLKLLRGMLDVEFRKSLKDTAFSGSVLTVTDKPLAAVPQQILVAPPKGFRVVKEAYLDLLRNGQQTHDLAGGLTRIPGANTATKSARLRSSRCRTACTCCKRCKARPKRNA
ncbi:hypothetical protein [Methylomonas koyamae]|uniref:hypothetical protein n=1 Tax=Methylomonas koyamae TaxID=702114 RepID=UPI0006CFE3DE|nr:hypothetical protein [Methylomonas koyamae]